MAIEYDKLKKYLETLNYNDFKNGLIEEGNSIYDIEKFKMNKSKIKLSSVIFHGEPFLVDLYGNDLTIVYLTKKRYKISTGRSVQCKIDRTIISDCKKTYGSCLNGYWKIPEEFITKGIIS